jgi:hypothetical protein
MTIAKERHVQANIFVKKKTLRDNNEMSLASYDNLK